MLKQMCTSIVIDSAAKCSIAVQPRDSRTMINRYESEGLSFLTITLPKFLEDFMEALENSAVTSNQFIGWKKRSCLPAFLQGFTSKVFCTEDGRLLHEPDKKAIQCVRQICSTFKKLLVPCSEKRNQQAFDSYLKIEEDMEFLLQDIDWCDYQRYLSIARILWSEVFDEVNIDDIIPQHGPGSTAESFKGNDKYRSQNVSWPLRLNEYFHRGECLYSSCECEHLSLDEVHELTEEEELPVKVILVPKTLKTPRVIAMEPVAMQMVQQGVKDWIIERLEKSPLTQGHINFSDQTVNQNLALSGSINLHNATIDMSAASDRIHSDLIYDMLTVNPILRDLVFCCRSTSAELPSGVIPLNKFASMGSALCFPIEAMFFYTLCIQGLLKTKGLPPSRKNIFNVTRELYVYGDDIIIPKDSVEAVFDTLTAFGNVPSVTKSFYKGRFRESCGMDAYAGLDITPVYMRRPPKDGRWDSSTVISMVAFANQLYEKGFICSSECVKNYTQLHFGSIPKVGDQCAGIGFSFGDERGNITRYSKELQRIEVRSWVPVVKMKTSRLNGYQALNKCLRPRHEPNGNQSFVRNAKLLFDATYKDKDHLFKSALKGVVTLRRKWVSPQL